MVQDRQCDFCDDDIEPGTGTMFVRTNGATIHYCSSKCEKNHDLGREARDLEWAGDRDGETADEGDLEDGSETEPAAAGGAEEVEADESGAESGRADDETVEAETDADETDRDDEETEAEA